MDKDIPSDDYPRVDHARERRAFLFQRGGFVGAPDLIDLGPSTRPDPSYNYRNRTKTEFNLHD